MGYVVCGLMTRCMHDMYIHAEQPIPAAVRLARRRARVREEATGEDREEDTHTRCITAGNSAL